ncbi:hypothetical protein BTW15_26240 [Pseudomonas syringae pv. tomato]|uniref:Uncharacterized protein n=2 Tax=Pseudomonas syringae group TaxID=136849 RepID=A0A0Q0B883_PSESX|nr:hypothetical protein XJ28_14890 [Pseudomonas syringae pv. tomato]EGH95435.1 hypothetical protein PLA106_05412 [Pseudomonas amygdali pv. lachrymans str. M302278]KPB77118.1 Uncharacterized protein AC505_0095 [Pseudomonas syringae pv. maculicola]KPC06183.1 Uncharacterized protein AC500_4582 [Pseudomonas amygdali pv. lachrymans]KPY70730.1 Uncharacterized protein ALO94_01030 [Pseudomonas syringae pv. spinaceae]QBI63360.1 hypothetical protein EIZ61_18775 [Pseudomonas syringae]
MSAWLLGHNVFKEPVDTHHWLGVTLILVGLLLLGQQA